MAVSNRFYGRTRKRPLVQAVQASLAAIFFSGYVMASSTALPPNLGNGLDQVVKAKSAAYRDASADEQGNAMYDVAIVDAQGRVLVRINPSPPATGKQAAGIQSLATTLSSNLSSLEVTAVDDSYHGVGVMNAWISLDEVAALATSSGVRSVILELQPRHGPVPSTAQAIAARAAGGGSQGNAIAGDTFNKLGTAFDAGVTQHRVDQINRFYNPSAAFDYEGDGISIGFMSNSYDAITGNPASVDVANFDLPGDPANPVNTQPVVVLEDYLDATTTDDEGRAMVQIGYKMAPKARLAFATANLGEVGFANNIRALAALPNYSKTPDIQMGFAADVICDDVGYFDEPFFQDGVVGNAVDDVTAAGVSYFSSAANDVGTDGYESQIRLVQNGTGLTAAAGNTALAGTNINLTNVPTALYAGGFHNFNPNPGLLDVAQLVNVAAKTRVRTILQWNDPYDQGLGFHTGAQIYVNTGDFTGTPLTFDGSSTPPLPPFVAGQAYQVREVHTSGDYDAVVSIFKPDGTLLVSQDVEQDETVGFVAPVSGQYSIVFDHFSTTTGTFNFTVNDATYNPTAVTSDWNLLVFDKNGNYLPNSSLKTNNIASNEPLELGFTNPASGQTQVQFVFALAATPAAGSRVADRIRYLLPANGLGGYGPAEYFTYNTPTTGGHAMASGTNGTAAYAVWRQSLPEDFTSPGPTEIYFDAMGNSLSLPEIRQQPRIAAADGANVSKNMSFFASPDVIDTDDDPNFYGTSAAAPHAAAVAALVLQAHGGRHSVTPAQMTSVLERSTFPHDLDPNYVSGVARTSAGETVRITVRSDLSSNSGTGVLDLNSSAISYSGSGSLSTLSFNPDGTSATAGNVSGGNNGVSDITPATTPPTVSYFENSFPGVTFSPPVFPFTVSPTSGIPAGSVTATFTNQAPAPAAVGETWTMNLAFTSGAFSDGKTLNYSIARVTAHSAEVDNGTGPEGGSRFIGWSGDMMGGGVILPSGAVQPNGMSFSGTTSNGTFRGVLKNRVGQGYSPLDGYGFIDAQTAVGQVIQ